MLAVSRFPLTPLSQHTIRAGCCGYFAVLFLVCDRFERAQFQIHEKIAESRERVVSGKSVPDKSLRSKK